MKERIELTAKRELVGYYPTLRMMRRELNRLAKFAPPEAHIAVEKVKTGDYWYTHLTAKWGSYE